MTLFVCVTDVEPTNDHCDFGYTAEASELGWAPGFFPGVLETNLGNKQRLVRTELNAVKAVYQQVGGCIKLTVFND